MKYEDGRTMDPEDQVKLWVAGKSVHNGSKEHPFSECCPDFSCCYPDLLWPLELRLKFQSATTKERHSMLGMALSALIAKECDVAVHVAGEGIKQ